VKDALSRRGRYAFLTEIIHRCQQLAGLLAGTMTHDHAYEFVRIGRNLERADMTTRVIDIGALSQEGTEEYGGIDVHVWTSMLRAMNAYQMYRKDVQLGVQREAVVKYLLQNNYFPRSFAHCLNQVEESICNLPHQRTPLKSVRDVHRRVDRIKPKNLDAYMLHAEVDRLQAELNTVHDEIGKTWFV